MSKLKGYVNTLNRSTKVTLLSCGCFVAMTVLILVFFIFFPITPSERIMASIGRENIFNGGDDQSQSVTPGVVTTADKPKNTEKTSKQTGTTTTRTYKIVITSGSGFMWNGRIPTGMTGYETTTTPILDDPEYPGVDPTDPGVDPTEPGVTPTEPGGGEQPIDPPAPTDAPPPPATEPPVQEQPGGGDTPDSDW